MLRNYICDKNFTCIDNASILMINSNREYKSVVYRHPNSGYYLFDDSAIDHLVSSQFICDGCEMSRLTMSCYAATKHQYPEADNKVARVQAKEKKPSKERPANKYGEMDGTVSLDKYNGKLMNSIWGLYNRNSPHNFKSLQNADNMSMSKEQGMMTDKQNGSSSAFVQFSIPQFSGMIAVETTYEVKKPQTSLEKIENLFTSPIF